ncbi:unnamed protein product [Pieris brassicae]|uniref:C2H2-type domain-containing protein n=1 Tax=Pieris brassicae TaxID=7116 RepID=A0A9P0XBV9_PIEBR|nr:unnamed protein product [Pieris brassicae]
MAEVITVKVEPYYYDENAEELKSDQQNDQNDVCSEEIKTEEDAPQMNIDFVDIKSEVDTSIVKDEPQENDFILPDLDARDGPPMLGCGVDEELNANAVSNGKYTCDACHRGFDTTQFLTEHKTIHQKQNLECHMCSEKLPNREKYYAHINEHDTDGKFKCTQCTFGCKRKSALLKHQEIHLSKKKNVQCMVCDKIFPRESRLIYHMRSHTNSRPFGCDLCVKKFFNKQNLIKHYKDKHPNASYTITTSDATVAKLVWQKIQKKLKEGGKFE